MYGCPNAPIGMFFDTRDFNASIQRVHWLTLVLDWLSFKIQRKYTYINDLPASILHFPNFYSEGPTLPSSY
jgi:hypothetical protein